MTAIRTLAELQQAITVGTPFRSPRSGFRLQGTGMYVLSSAAEFAAIDELGESIREGQLARTARYVDPANVGPAAWAPLPGEPVYVVADLAGHVMAACIVGGERSITFELTREDSYWSQYTPRQQEAIRSGIMQAAEHRTRMGWDFQR